MAGGRAALRADVVLGVTQIPQVAELTGLERQGALSTTDVGTGGGTGAVDQHGHDSEGDGEHVHGYDLVIIMSLADAQAVVDQGK